MIEEKEKKKEKTYREMYRQASEFATRTEYIDHNCDDHRHDVALSLPQSAECRLKDGDA